MRQSSLDDFKKYGRGKICASSNALGANAERPMGQFTLYAKDNGW